MQITKRIRRLDLSDRYQLGKDKPINQPNRKPRQPGYDDNVEQKDSYRRPPMQV